MFKALHTALTAVTLSALLIYPAYSGDVDTYQLGPTGLFGSLSKNTAKVTKVAKGSPSDGKIKVGDEIIGAGSAAFKKDIRRELAVAVDEAETAKGGGRLTLILKGNSRVELQLTVLGEYSNTAPAACEKTKAIINRAAEYLVKSGKLSSTVTHVELLGLMATGEKKYIDAAAKSILAAEWLKPNAADIESLLAGDKDMGYVGWYWGYHLITLSEYYLLTKDASVLPAIKIYSVALARGQDSGGLYGHRMATPKRNGRLPGYAQMNQPSLSSFMGILMANKCGIDDPALKKGIEKTYAYYATYIGKGSFNYGVHGPNTAKFNNNGTSGSAALCMALKGNTAGAKFFSQLCATSYDDLESGHASSFFNPLWTPLGANLSGPEVTQQFFRKSLWLQTMFRSWDGSFKRYSDGERAGDQTGTALLALCLPRAAIFITGKDADRSIMVKGKEADDVVGMSSIDYKSKSADELISLFGHPIPQVTRNAVWALQSKPGDFSGRLLKIMKEGTVIEKQNAIGYYGYNCPPETAKPRLDDLGAILCNTKENAEVRAAAAASLSGFGEPAYKYYGDMLKLIVENRPEDRFGDIEASVGKSLNSLCGDPYKAGLVKDKDTFYKAAIKLADNRRQHARATGLEMLAGIPLEDFHIVADTVLHVVRNDDNGYHSYHSPGGSIGAGVTILSNLGIKEGMQYALDVLDDESGKGSFKLRMVMDSLAKYGASAKPMLEKVKADPRFKGVPENKKLSRNWRNMVKAIEEDKTPGKLISFEEAKKAGLKK